MSTGQHLSSFQGSADQLANHRQKRRFARHSGLEPGRDALAEGCPDGLAALDRLPSFSVIIRQHAARRRRGTLDFRLVMNRRTRSSPLHRRRASSSLRIQYLCFPQTFMAENAHWTGVRPAEIINLFCSFQSIPCTYRHCIQCTFRTHLYTHVYSQTVLECVPAHFEQTVHLFCWFPLLLMTTKCLFHLVLSNHATVVAFLRALCRFK